MKGPVHKSGFGNEDGEWEQCVAAGNSRFRLWP